MNNQLLICILYDYIYVFNYKTQDTQVRGRNQIVTNLTKFVRIMNS